MKTNNIYEAQESGDMRSSKELIAKLTYTYRAIVLSTHYSYIDHLAPYDILIQPS
jgi:hypothetical protein